MIALLICLIVTTSAFALASWKQAKRTRVRPTAPQLASYPPHSLETRRIISEGGVGVSLSDRIALADDLHRIVSLPEADVPPIGVGDDS